MEKKKTPHEYTIGDLIEVALRRYNFNESVTREQVEKAYRNVVGDFIVRLTRSVHYDVHTRTLRVALAAPALRQELSYKTSDLLSAINDRLRSQMVERIVFC